MKMIQITKWLDPNDETWFKGVYITTGEWLMIEKQRLSKLTKREKKKMKQAELASLKKVKFGDLYIVDDQNYFGLRP